MSRDSDELLLEYLESLPYEPYPLQEEALMSWYASDDGVMLCAPTGTGKTLVAEGALYEAVKSGRYAYYTTPLIALTDQKFQEMQETMVRWGFEADRVGLVTGNRSVNPHAQVLVVVAEILMNRLMHPEAFDFRDVGAVVMDEFHSFADPDRGIVWELTLNLLPKHVKMMLLSATVGNAREFLAWLKRCHQRTPELVQGTERKVPLNYHWVPDEMLDELLVKMNQGPPEQRKTPALVFCFDREACWNTAETLKGRDMIVPEKRDELLERLEEADLKGGVGPKLKQILKRGVGVHHAGLLPKHRRLVEELFQEKMLSVCVCTETLAAGLNLPARSVVLTTLVKGPKDRKKLIDTSSAKQMFGRAGRPQFDTEGHVYAVAHEDDVKIHRHHQKIAQIPEDTKDPGLIQMRKKLEKKKPTRRAGVTYWNPEQFEKLQYAEPGHLASRGSMPWRLLCFLLNGDPRIKPIRDVVGKRLMEPKKIEAEQRRLTQMLITLHELGYATLDPPPPPKRATEVQEDPIRASAPKKAKVDQAAPTPPTDTAAGMNLGAMLNRAKQAGPAGQPQETPEDAPPVDPLEAYDPQTAQPTEALGRLLVFRAVHPLFGDFLLQRMGMADDHERIQALEALMEMPGSVARKVRVPWPDELPPGTLAREAVDPAILAAGIATEEDLYPPPPSKQEDRWGDETKYPIPLGDKLKMLFEAQVPHAGPLRVVPVWAAGELLTFGGDFEKFIQARELSRQEGVIFRHLLRLILLCGEFAQVTPPGVLAEPWRNDLDRLAAELTQACRRVDPQSTDEMLEEARDAEASTAT